MKRYAIGAFVLLLYVFSSVADLGAEDIVFRSAGTEYAILSGYGTTHDGVGNRTHIRVQTFDVIGRIGWFLHDEAGPGCLKGRTQLLVELPLYLAVDPKVSPMVGGSLLGSWKFTSSEEFAPYLFFGGGVLYVDLGLSEMGSRVNFVYQGGAGIQHRFGKKTSLGLEYRYVHVSNAGLAKPNAPINSSNVLLSLSFFR